MITTEYYARNEEEKAFDDGLTGAYAKNPENIVIAHATMIGHLGAITNMLRHMEDRLEAIEKKLLQEPTYISFTRERSITNEKKHNPTKDI